MNIPAAQCLSRREAAEVEVTPFWPLAEGPEAMEVDSHCFPALAPQLLAALAGGETLSGARLAAATGVSRTAIWKQVEALRSRGVPVQSHGSAGYSLPWPLQMLDAEAIRVALPGAVRRRLGALDLYWEIDSTSSELQRRGAQAPDLSVVLAETQNAGRGRRGRAWLSPPGLNLYLSCLKRFDVGFAGNVEASGVNRRGQLFQQCLIHVASGDLRASLCETLHEVGAKARRTTGDDDLQIAELHRTLSWVWRTVENEEG